MKPSQFAAHTINRADVERRVHRPRPVRRPCPAESSRPNNQPKQPNEATDGERRRCFSRTDDTSLAVPSVSPRNRRASSRSRPSLGSEFFSRSRSLMRRFFSWLASLSRRVGSALAPRRRLSSIDTHTYRYQRAICEPRSEKSTLTWRPCTGRRRWRTARWLVSLSAPFIQLTRR